MQHLDTEEARRIYNRKMNQGKVNDLLVWLLAVPVLILLLIFLVRVCV